MCVGDYMVEGLRLVEVVGTSVTVTWGVTSRVTLYEVVYWPTTRPDNASSLLTSSSNATITSLLPNTEYNVQVSNNVICNVLVTVASTLDLQDIVVA
jgi:hypothetical protein